MTKLDEARLVANCRCYLSGKVIGRPPTMRGNLFLDWACRHEYWNKPRQGHLIAASLMGDQGQLVKPKPPARERGYVKSVSTDTRV